MFIVDKLVKPLSNRISFSDLTGSFSEAIKGLYQNVAAKDKIVTLCDHSTKNQVGTNPTLSNVRCLNVNGTSTPSPTTISGLPANTTISSYVSASGYGVATPTKNVADTTMTFTGGYGASIVDIKLNDGTHYPCQEGGGEVLYDVSGNGNHARIDRNSSGNVNASWVSTIADNIHTESWNNDNGFTLIAELDGSVSGFDTGFSSNDLDRYEIKMMSRFDDDDDGDFVFVDGGIAGSGATQQNRPTLYCTDSDVSGADTSLGKKVVLYKGHNTTGSGNFVHLHPTSLPKGGSGRVGTYFWDWSDPNNPTGGVDKRSFNYPDSIDTHDAHIFIGHRTSNNATNRIANGHFYYFKGYKDGVLKCHIVPTLEGRLKDVVNGNLLTGAHGGTTALKTIRIPMMNKKTTQVVTFDGTDDYIEADGGALPLADKEVVEVTFTAANSGGDRQTLWAQGDFAAVESAGGLSLIYDKPNKRLRVRVGTGNGGTSSYAQAATSNGSISYGGKVTATMTYDRANNTLEIKQRTYNFMGNTGTTQTQSVTIPSTALPPTTYTKTIRIGRGSSGTDKCACLIHSVKCSKFEFDFTKDIGTAVIQDKSTPIDIDVNGDFSNNGAGWTPYTSTTYGYSGSALSQVNDGNVHIISNTDDGSGGVLLNNNGVATSSLQGVERTNATVVGRKYRITVTIGLAKLGGLSIQTAGQTIELVPNPKTAQTYTAEFTAKSTSLIIKRRGIDYVGGLPTDIIITNIKLEDLDGQDAAIASGFLQTIWGQRIDDANGTIVSADYANNTLEPTHPNGYVHNANEAALTFITTGTTTVEKTKAQLDAHVNGTNNLYISREGDYITRLVQYDTTYTLTAEEQEINNAFFE